MPTLEQFIQTHRPRHRAAFSSSKRAKMGRRKICTRALASRCLAELRGQESVLRLGTVPLFLVMICIAFEETNRIAYNRAELYRTTVDALLSKWDVTRGILREEPDTHT